MTLATFKTRSGMSWAGVGKLISMSRQAAWGLAMRRFVPTWATMLAIQHATMNAVTATEKDWPRHGRRRRSP